MLSSSCRIFGALALLLAVLAHPLAAAADEPTPLAAAHVVSLPLVFGKDAPRFSSSASDAEQMVGLMNDVRAASGCQALIVVEPLNTAAQGHAADMASHNFLDHTGSDGSEFDQRAERVGYVHASAEIIAAGHESPDATLQQWLNSPGHSAIIHNCALSEVGVGHASSAASRYGDYWSASFGTP